MEEIREESSFHLRLQAQAESGVVLRERLGLWVDELGANDEEAYDIALATSEAFANAVEHPHEPSAAMIEVEGSISDHTVSITITDFGSWQQEPQHEDGGYGFPMMRKLMDTVSVDRRAEGTSVTLRLRVASLT